MRGLFPAVTLIACGMAAGQTAQTVTISADGWSVAADTGNATLRISHEKLGTILDNVRLYAENGTERQAVTSWSAASVAANQLAIRAADPRTTWVFEVDRNALRISCTVGATISGTAPAPVDRVVARILDPEGVPVSWVGTNEIGDSYGGTETRKPSFLPRRNPDVMYLALGQVSGLAFHDLFDRKTDTAIHFPEDTVMKRNNSNSALLDVTIPVPGNAMVQLMPDYFTKTLGVPFYAPFDDSRFPRAPAVWSSWTSYYADVTERDILRNTDWLAEHLKPYGFDYVQLDDGYDRGKDGEHYWISNWDLKKFPHGPEWLAGYIKSKGLRPGIWIVPNAYAGAVAEHPEWYLRDKNGRIILDYHTPSLDSTNPKVIEFLKTMFSTLDKWGFEYYKFDGEHAMPRYVPAVDKTKLYDKAIEPLAAYRARLRAIRETIGPDRFVEGCPAGTPLNGIGYFNSYFNGHDLYNNWQGMYPMFSSINANGFLNHMVTYVMPGEGVELGPLMTVEEVKQKRHPSVIDVAKTREEPLAGFGTTLAEARTLVTYLSLTGVVYPLASIMPELPAERVGLLKVTLPPMPVLPMDLFSRGTDMQWNRFKFTTPDDYIHNYPEILDLKVNAAAGVYDVVGATNWRSRPVTRRIGFGDKLGLQAGAYVVFDYWAQKPLGVFHDAIDLEIEPHDTRVLSIHPLPNRPALVGISRHITGAYSVEEQSWDAAANRLSGKSAAIAGAPYAMWIYVPRRFSVAEVKAVTADNRAVPVEQSADGDSLKVTFPGQEQPVRWAIRFAAGN